MKRIVVVIATLIICIILLVATFYYIGLFRKDLPDTKSMVVLGSFNEGSGLGLVSVIYTDGSVYFMTYERDWSSNGTILINIGSDNELSKNAGLDLINLLNCSDIPTPDASIKMTFSRSFKLNNDEFNKISELTTVTNLTQLDSFYYNESEGLSNYYYRIWNDTDSKLIEIYAGNGPETLNEIRLAIYTAIYDRWPNPGG